MYVASAQVATQVSSIVPSLVAVYDARLLMLTRYDLMCSRVSSTDMLLPNKTSVVVRSAVWSAQWVPGRSG